MFENAKIENFQSRKYRKRKNTGKMDEKKETIKREYGKENERIHCWCVVCVSVSVCQLRAVLQNSSVLKLKLSSNRREKKLPNENSSARS